MSMFYRVCMLSALSALIVRAIGATEVGIDSHGEIDATVMLQNPEPKVEISGKPAQKSMEAKKSSHGAQEAEQNPDPKVEISVELAQKSIDAKKSAKTSIEAKKSSRGAQEVEIQWSAAFAEYVAMTLFVVIGCGSAMGSAKEPGWVLQVALTFGFAITSLAYAIGHYSGGQINCAVTLGLYLSGNLTAAQAILNFVAQMLGSITGALLLMMIYDAEHDKTGGLARNKVQPGYTYVNAFFGEAIMTFLLMFVVLETAINPESAANRELACVAIGFAVFLAHSVLIPIDGCSINPTRTFGPALISKMFYKGCEDSLSGDYWVFCLGPLSGAAGAAYVYYLL